MANASRETLMANDLQAEKLKRLFAIRVERGMEEVAKLELDLKAARVDFAVQKASLNSAKGHEFTLTQMNKFYMNLTTEEMEELAKDDAVRAEETVNKHPVSYTHIDLLEITL